MLPRADGGAGQSDGGRCWLVSAPQVSLPASTSRATAHAETSFDALATFWREPGEWPLKEAL